MEVFDRTDLIKAVAKTQGVTQKDAARLVDDVFDALVNGIVTTGAARIKNLGLFKVKSRVAQEGVIGFGPAKGQPYNRAADKVVKFTPSGEFDTLLNR